MFHSMSKMGDTGMESSIPSSSSGRHESDELVEKQVSLVPQNVPFSL